MAEFENIAPNTNKQKISKNGPQLLKAAVRAHKTGDIENAEVLYLNTINSGFHHEIAFSNLGVIYKNTGRKGKAIAIYKRAIAKNPNFASAYTNLGNLYKDLGSLDKALASTLKSLELKPDNPTALINLGGIYKDLGNLDQALASTLKSLELKPDDPIAHMNLGGIYNDLGNLDQALAYTLKSLELKPDNPTAYMNVGSLYKDLGNLDQALAYTLKSLKLKPDDPVAHMNLGNIYQYLGNLDQALSSTLKSLELKPDNPDALMNLGITYETFNELDSALESYTKSANLIAQNNKASSLTSMISSSAILLQMNRIDDATKALSTASAIFNKDIALKQGSRKNRKNIIAYLCYLSKLMPEIPTIKTTAEPQILHLGDSHCLSFANQTIELKGDTCTIKTSLVKGAKAFHLSEESKTNKQRIGFEKRLRQNLDLYKYIFLSFGEIDCREDEGILLYCRKSGKAIQDIAKTTATKYFKWTATSLSRYKDRIVYFGTPAPFKTYPNSEESPENNEQRLLAITVFNTTLAKQCQESGTLFADVYKLTADKNGYNNNDWMIDSVHLKPKALNELVKAF